MANIRVSGDVLSFENSTQMHVKCRFKKRIILKLFKEIIFMSFKLMTRIKLLGVCEISNNSLDCTRDRASNLPDEDVAH